MRLRRRRVGYGPAVPCSRLWPRRAPTRGVPAESGILVADRRNGSGSSSPLGSPTPARGRRGHRHARPRSGARAARRQGVGARAAALRPRAARGMRRHDDRRTRRRAGARPAVGGGARPGRRGGRGELPAPRPRDRRAGGRRGARRARRPTADLGRPAATTTSASRRTRSASSPIRTSVVLADVRRRAYGGDADVRRLARHADAVGDVERAVVDAGEDVALQVDHPVGRLAISPDACVRSPAALRPRRSAAVRTPPRRS